MRRWPSAIRVCNCFDGDVDPRRADAPLQPPFAIEDLAFESDGGRQLRMGLGQFGQGGELAGVRTLAGGSRHGSDSTQPLCGAPRRGGLASGMVGHGSPSAADSRKATLRCHDAGVAAAPARAPPVPRASRRPAPACRAAPAGVADAAIAARRFGC